MPPGKTKVSPKHATERRFVANDYMKSLDGWCACRRGSSRSDRSTGG